MTRTTCLFVLAIMAAAAVSARNPLQPMQGLADFHEATWVHKRNGRYYLSYSDNHDSAGRHNRSVWTSSFTTPMARFGW